jgi:hypothetical protein
LRTSLELPVAQITLYLDADARVRLREAASRR